VLAADGEVVDDDVVVGAPADRGPILGQTDLAEHHAIQTQDQPRHFFPLGSYSLLSRNSASP
jgi:hypothetical protein